MQEIQITMHLILNAIDYAKVAHLETEAYRSLAIAQIERDEMKMNTPWRKVVVVVVTVPCVFQKGPTRVAEVDSLSARAKMAIIKTFVKRVFTIFAKYRRFCAYLQFCKFNSV